MKDKLEITVNQPEVSKEDIRKKLWCDVAVAIASSSNSTNRESCENWADHVLRAFDKRF